jgi:predicted DNA-binding protein (MmcQ/YjbR family)
MKMTPEQYQSLKADVNKIAVSCHLLRRPDTSIAVMWALFHEVNAQRSYGDDHPRWAKRQRVLPASHVDSQSWLTELYDSGLNDNHLKTALMKIASEWA